MTDTAPRTPAASVEEVVASLSSPEVAAMEAAMMETWPSHFEGSMSQPPSEHDSTWSVIDPAVPTRTLASRLIAALRSGGYRLVSEDDLGALDVERLWRAIRSTRSTVTSVKVADAPVVYYSFDREREEAAAIASEYVRLSEAGTIESRNGE